MERVAISTRRKEGSAQRAAAGLIGDPFHFKLQRARDQWLGIAVGEPRVPRERFGLQLAEARPVAAPARDRSEPWA
jgi:hypothetical protein